MAEVWIWATLLASGAAVVCAVGWLSACRQHRLLNQDVLSLAEESAGFGVWEHDRTRNITTLSAGAARLSGYPAIAGQRLSTELLERIHPDDREQAVREAREGQAF